jgi:hypothetical protein
MERFQYAILAWVKLSEREEELASSWYRGVGWYMNSCDESGTLTCNLISPTQPGSAAGALEALDTCGKEGWEVATFLPDPMPAPAPTPLLGDVVNMLVSWASGFEAAPLGGYFVLKRRSMS